MKVKQDTTMEKSRTENLMGQESFLWKMGLNFCLHGKMEKKIAIGNTSTPITRFNVVKRKMVMLMEDVSYISSMILKNIMNVRKENFMELGEGLMMMIMYSWKEYTTRDS